MPHVVSGPFIIKERIRRGDMKMCDSCGRILISEDIIGAEECFLTEHGLLCAECVCKIKSLRIRQEDNTVWNER